MKKEKKDKDENIVYDNDLEKSSFSMKSDSKLKKRIKELEKEKGEYLDGWQRSQADIINLKKTHTEEKKVFTQIGKQSFLEEIIPILDNFDAAFSNKKAWEETPIEWRSGIEYIYNQFIIILENNGVQQFGLVGDDFDEIVHSSVENIKTTNGEDKNKISAVMQKGYKIKDRVIRSAKVKVFI